VIIEAGEVPDEVLETLLQAAPDDPGDPEGWRQALGAALTEWEKRPRDPVPSAHECTWRAVGVQHRDMVFGVKQTDALQRCDGCGDVRTQVLTGTWTLEDLRS
jgi:hypothetical protein